MSEYTTLKFTEAEESLSRLRERRAGAEHQQSNDDESRKVTQSITIPKAPRYLRSISMDNPLSPPGSSPPISPASRKLALMICFLSVLGINDNLFLLSCHEFQLSVNTAFMFVGFGML